MDDENNKWGAQINKCHVYVGFEYFFRKTDIPDMGILYVPT